MTRMDVYASALEDMSRRFLRIAAVEGGWEREALREHARTLDRIAVDLIVADETTTHGWRR